MHNLWYCMVFYFDGGMGSFCFLVTQINLQMYEYQYDYFEYTDHDDTNCAGHNQGVKMLPHVVEKKCL